MVQIKLLKLPDRTPVKIAISVMPDLAEALSAYAAFYHETYGREEPVAEVVPAMLKAFLDADRGFQKKAGQLFGGPSG